MVQRRGAPPEASATSTGGSSAAMLQELLGNVEQATKQVTERMDAQVDLGSTFDALQKDLDEAAKIENDEERRVRMRVLTTSLEEIRSRMPQDEKDLATAVFSLNGYLEGLGKEYKALGERNVGEQAIVDTAKQAVVDAEAAFTDAKASRFFRGTKVRNAEEALATAKAGVSAAEAQADQLARTRLRSADTEQSLQVFQVYAQKIKTIIQERRKAVEAMIGVVTARKDAAFAIKAQAATALEKFDADLTRLEAELQGAEEKLSSLENGSSDHSAQSQIVSDLRVSVQEIGGRRNTAFAMFQSKETYCEEHEIHLISQRKMYDNLTLWMTVIQSDTEERVVTFRSWVEARKAASDQDAAQKIDKIGKEIDRQATEDMAAFGAASDRLRMERIKDHPKRMRDVARVQAAQAEATAQIRLEMGEAIAAFKEKYGIDPTASSFFSYEGGKEGDAGEPAPKTF